MSDAQQHPDTLKLINKMRQANDASLNYQEFIDYALYDPEYGYYRRESKRVGRNQDSDFYTSQSMGPVFGALVTDAVVNLLAEYEERPINLKDWTFVEVGYESDSGWWADDEGPFGDRVRIGSGDPIDFSGRCVVFSNELFDAQPFHRVLFMNGQWHELGVSISEGNATEVILPDLSPQVREFSAQLPLEVEDGYVLDLPLATRPLLKKMTGLNWSGLFLAIDYGKSWSELAHDFPQGTARAYFKHQQSAHLTNQPGMQDLTCHICWDWLQEDLVEAGFDHINLQSQEAFFVKHAVRCIESIITANSGDFDPQRQSLMHLIHPATMGQQFQVLSGYRVGYKFDRITE
jgi:SAM-dependent MidA family methyltransferase